MKMNKYLVTYMQEVTYMQDQTFDTVNNIVVEAYSVEDIDDNIMQLLMDAGLDMADADYIESEHSYFVQDLDSLMDSMVSVQY